MGKDLNKVYFSAYCRAFESLDENAARMICSNLDPSEGVYAVAYLERGKRGDGVVSVPEYRIEAAQLKVAGLRFLTEAGSFFKENDFDTPFAAVDPEMAKYFIAGAFGISELVQGASTDYGIILGLQNVYKLCRHDPEICLGSDAAKDVAGELKALKSAREEEANAKMAREDLERKQNEVSELQLKFNKNYILAPLTKEEKERISMIRTAMPVIFTSDADYELASELFRVMIKITEKAKERESSANYAKKGPEVKK